MELLPSFYAAMGRAFISLNLSFSSCEMPLILKGPARRNLRPKGDSFIKVVELGLGLQTENDTSKCKRTEGSCRQRE